MNAPIVVSDTELDWWAARFNACGIAQAVTFEQFMGWSPAMRERRLRLFATGEKTQAKLEAEVPDAVHRGQHLVEPLHHDIADHTKPGHRHHSKG